MTSSDSALPADTIEAIEMAPLLPAADCPRPDGRALLDWWLAQPRGGAAASPDWLALDPVSLLKWMGWICLYDVIDGGRDVRYRLVGTRITEQAGVDLTGRLVSEGVYASTPAVLLEHFRRLDRAPAPTWTKRVMETRNGFIITHDRIWLPFTRGGGPVVMWLLYLCQLDAAADRLDVARLAGPEYRHRDRDLAPVTLNPPDQLRR